MFNSLNLINELSVASVTRATILRSKVYVTRHHKVQVQNAP